MFTLKRRITEINLNEILDRYFNSPKNSNKYVVTPEILRICLKKYEDRPNCIELKNSLFFKQFSTFSFGDVEEKMIVELEKTMIKNEMNDEVKFSAL